MNIYEKLIKCRLELKNKDLKKSGMNKFVNFNYYELCDFLPAIVDLCDKYKLITVFNSTKDVATLAIKDCEKPETILFEMPFENPQIKGANAVQNLGGAITYLRRYLFMTAFEIVENDVSDATIGKSENSHSKPNAPKETQKTPVSPPMGTISEPQAKRLFAISKECGYDNVLVKELLKEKYNIESSKNLTKKEYDEFITYMQTNKLNIDDIAF